MRRFCWSIGAVLALFAGQVQAANCPPMGDGLLLDGCAKPTRADLILLSPDEGVPSNLLVSDPASSEKTMLVVTGAYTSGEKVEPEGFVLDHGTPYDPYVQGWDGLLLITPEGDLSIHNVARVKFRGSHSNLRDSAQRRAFVARARQLGLSAIQSHLLISDGVLDVRDVSGAPRFRRRIVFSYAEGGFGIYDSGERALTLFEAAREVERDYGPDMAFNLDMGSYDYCAFTRGGETQSCGSLNRSRTAKLSNILVFTQD